MKKEEKHKEELEQKKEIEKKVEKKEKNKETKKEIKENKKIEEFLQEIKIEKVSPSLKMINSEPAQKSLEQSLGGVSIPENKEENEFDYSGRNPKKEKEHQYQNYDNPYLLDKNLIKKDIEEFGREELSQKREVAFIPTPDVIARKDKETDYVSVMKVEKERFGRDASLDKKGVKYEVSEKIGY